MASGSYALLASFSGFCGWFLRKSKRSVRPIPNHRRRPRSLGPRRRSARCRPIPSRSVRRARPIRPAGAVPGVPIFRPTAAVPAIPASRLPSSARVRWWKPAAARRPSPWVGVVRQAPRRSATGRGPTRASSPFFRPPPPAAPPGQPNPPWHGRGLATPGHRIPRHWARIRPGPVAGSLAASRPPPAGNAPPVAIGSRRVARFRFRAASSAPSRFRGRSSEGTGRNSAIRGLHGHSPVCHRGWANGPGLALLPAVLRRGRGEARVRSAARADVRKTGPVQVRSAALTSSSESSSRSASVRRAGSIPG